MDHPDWTTLNFMENFIGTERVYLKPVLDIVK